MQSSYMNDFLPVNELNLFVNFTRKKIGRGLLDKTVPNKYGDLQSYALTILWWRDRSFSIVFRLR